eukprot:9014615-Pyramimonas_sp.AAC.1
MHPGPERQRGKEAKARRGLHPIQANGSFEALTTHATPQCIDNLVGKCPGNASRQEGYYHHHTKDCGADKSPSKHAISEGKRHLEPLKYE